MPTLKQFLDFLENKSLIMEATNMSISTSNQQQGRNKPKSLLTAPNKLSCFVCKDSHLVYTCQKFKRMSAKERRKAAAESQVCFNCLRTGHKRSDCTGSGCKKCGEKHSTWLHLEHENALQES